MFAYIQAVELELPPVAVSALTRQNTDCPGAGVGAVPQGTVRLFSVVVSLQYHVPLSDEVKLLLLHCTKYFVKVSAQVLLLRDTSVQVKDLQLLD